MTLSKCPRRPLTSEFEFGIGFGGGEVGSAAPPLTSEFELGFGFGGGEVGRRCPLCGFGFGDGMHTDGLC